MLTAAYMKATGVTIGSLSRKAHSDNKFLSLFQRGKVSVTARKYDQIVAWFDENWPDGVERPVINEVFSHAK